MKKEQIAQRAAYQYRHLRSHDTALKGSLAQPLYFPPRSNSLEKLRMMNIRDRNIRDREASTKQLSADAQSLYRNHHAALYEMALEEMEAEGVHFNTGDPYEQTAYDYDRDIAAVEGPSPLDNLGARISLTGEKYTALAQLALAGERL